MTALALEKFVLWTERSALAGITLKFGGAWVFVSILINVFVVHSRTAGSLAGHGHHMAYFLLLFQRL